MDAYGYSPLHYAAKYRRYDILLKLLEKGASKFNSFSSLLFISYFTQIPEISANYKASETGVNSVDKSCCKFPLILF